MPDLDVTNAAYAALNGRYIDQGVNSNSNTSDHWYKKSTNDFALAHFGSGNITNYRFWEFITNLSGDPALDAQHVCRTAVNNSDNATSDPTAAPWADGAYEGAGAAYIGQAQPVLAWAPTTPNKPSAPTLASATTTTQVLNIPALQTGGNTLALWGCEYGGTPVLIASVTANAGSTYTRTGLTALTRYSYEIIETNGSGASPASDLLSVYTTAIPPAFESATVPASGEYVDVAITTDSPPLLPATDITGWSVKVNGIARSITSAVRHADKVIRLTLASAVLVGDNVAVSYADGNVTDSSE